MYSFTQVYLFLNKGIALGKKVVGKASREHLTQNHMDSNQGASFSPSVVCSTFVYLRKPIVVQDIRIQLVRQRQILNARG